MNVEALRFPGREFDPSTGVARFHYALGDLVLTETVDFGPPSVLHPALDRVLDLLYVAASTSYYKIAAPRKVELGFPVAEKAWAWVTALFREGLGEFAYQNKLDYVLDLEIVPGPWAEPPAETHEPSGPPLAAVGGGKDSIVTMEALQRAGLDPVLFAVNPNPIIRSVMAVSPQPVRAVRRTLDPRMRELNAAGAYNGHIPVTAINSLIAVAASLMHGLGPVVMSNESSASVPNLSWLGRDINHQWSKGLPAEAHLRDALLAHAGLQEAYFSLLRGLSELHIAALFAKFTAYDAVVTSCNAAFKQRDATDRWCGHCPKCRFVFLAMAPFTGRERLLGIFGTDIFADPTQLPGYRELMGLTAHKPFECVGEIEESLVALRLLAEQDEWKDTLIVSALTTEVRAGAGLPSDAEVEATFRGDGPNLVPPVYLAALEGLGAAR
ncbi:UDP-N-acetyl-alpha-D-muramoyl-L-alanyl-L-glutamat e epimerase [Dactylosporangium maewongense]|uniref:UDP-N-acetyl-alpha-D-muramoyl-L-alanyl-L-glutamate epimerase n=1 Tax=Dactylosporangium maewongense TaxID=634393 RepID=A0ABP4L2Y7_9ACTN